MLENGNTQRATSNKQMSELVNKQQAAVALAGDT
jgi:hypothetical protein